MTPDGILTSVDQYYSAKLQANGPTARGVDWNSSESQELRFRQLLQVCEAGSIESLNDFGCGYGALANYLAQHGPDCAYRGYDISLAMIEQARALHATNTQAAFYSDYAQVPPAAYTIASGIFNVRLSYPDDVWQRYVEATLAQIDQVSERGFAFNMLTSYSDHDRQRPDLYYADPRAWFDTCKRRFSRYVTLLHDYPLYEFTLIVRKAG